jgi:hypothetical protein
VTCILSICESVCYVHEFCYYFWLDVTHFFDKVCSTEPGCEGIDCSFIRNIDCWILYNTPCCMYERKDSLYFWVQALTSSVDVGRL